MITKVKYLEDLIEYKFPKNEFTILHSAWLSLMNIRINGDLDILISNNLRKNNFSSQDKFKVFGLPGMFEKRIRIHPVDTPYINFFGTQSVDELIYKNSLQLNGINFIYPKFYFEYKKLRLEKLIAVKKKQNILLRNIFFYKNKYRVLNKKINKDVNDFKEIELFLNSNEFEKFNLEYGIKNYNDVWGLKKIFKDYYVQK